jgi:hypothetical protein
MNKKEEQKYSNLINICIPCIDNDIKISDIYKSIIALNIGYISSVYIKKQEGKSYNKAIIYLKYWYNNTRANKLKDLLMNGKEFNFVYKFPYYWKCVLYKQHKNQYNKNHIIKI